MSFEWGRITYSPTPHSPFRGRFCIEVIGGWRMLVAQPAPTETLARLPTPHSLNNARFIIRRVALIADHLDCITIETQIRLIPIF